MMGGSLLGTQKQLPDKLLDKIAKVLAEYKIHGLLIIGGFEVSKFNLFIAYTFRPIIR